MPELPKFGTAVRDPRPRMGSRLLASVKVSELPLRVRWSAAQVPVLTGRRIQTQGWRSKLGCATTTTPGGRGGGLVRRP
jgi:hypothetical protein